MRGWNGRPAAIIIDTVPHAANGRISLRRIGKRTCMKGKFPHWCDFALAAGTRDCDSLARLQPAGEFGAVCGRVLGQSEGSPACKPGNIPIGLMRLSKF
jgi:hypothetical protein